MGLVNEIYRLTALGVAVDPQSNLKSFSLDRKVFPADEDTYEHRGF